MARNAETKKRHAITAADTGAAIAQLTLVPVTPPMALGDIHLQVVGNGAAFQAAPFFNTDIQNNALPSALCHNGRYTISFAFPANTFNSSVPVDTNLAVERNVFDETLFPDSLRLPMPPPLSPVSFPTVLTTLQAANKQNATSLEKNYYQGTQSLATKL
ncbi:hypothetical protein K438DRAFT_1787045 [Mycena galopus ATCC 62051]|nr:hypothetical protein K438DRAFT_1787045 [Mycena galopus ATCC 62051]